MCRFRPVQFTLFTPYFGVYTELGIDPAKPSIHLSGAAVVIASFGANKTNSLLVVMTLKIARALPKTVLKREQEWRIFYSEQRKAIHKGYAYFVPGSVFPDIIFLFQCGFLMGSVRSRHSMPLNCWKVVKSPEIGRFQDSFQIASGHIPILAYRRR